MNGVTEFSPGLLLIAGFGFACIPLLLASTTSFVKIGIVISVLRNAFGVQGIPGKMGEFALTFCLTLTIMFPVFESSLLRFNERKAALVSSEKGLDYHGLLHILQPFVDFMNEHTSQKEREFIENLRAERRTETSASDEVLNSPLHGLAYTMPAFLLTELRSGFELGFAILLPFLVVDLLISNLLVGMGLTMVSPTTISFPIKILLFVTVDGWLLVTRGLILSYL